MMLRKLSLALAVWLGLGATAPAAAPYKALIVTGQNGHQLEGHHAGAGQTAGPDRPVHGRRGYVSPAKGQDMSGFAPKFADYQVVVLNYQGDPWPEPDQAGLRRLRQAGRRGGGLPFRPGGVPGVERVQPDHRPGRLGGAQ
jgi:hypothetical protein